LIAHAQAVRPARPTPPRKKCQHGFRNMIASRSLAIRTGPKGHHHLCSERSRRRGLRACWDMCVARNSRVSERRDGAGTFEGSRTSRITRHTPHATHVWPRLTSAMNQHVDAPERILCRDQCDLTIKHRDGHRREPVGHGQAERGQAHRVSEKTNERAEWRQDSPDHVEARLGGDFAVGVPGDAEERELGIVEAAAMRRGGESRKQRKGKGKG
jgi:hypothetical protein